MRGVLPRQPVKRAARFEACPALEVHEEIYGCPEDLSDGCAGEASVASRFLGTPRDVFEPCDFGDPWTKRTALWGNFRLPVRGPFVAPTGGGHSVRSARAGEGTPGAANQRTAPRERDFFAAMQ